MRKILQYLIESPPGDVEFLVEPEDNGVIPPPIPARKVMPDWFKTLVPKIDGQDKLENSTIKRCAPFLDAMTMGWIIPLAADVEFITNDGADDVKYKWKFYKNMVENHNTKQVEGHSSLPKPPMKFLNYIYIKIPPGYSALFVPPLNRPDPRFQCIAGMVDDTYMGNGAFEYINFPFFFTQPKYTGIIKAGTPLVQLILIKRDQIQEQSERAIKVHTISSQDRALVELTRRRRLSNESLYRNTLWHNAKGNKS